MIELLCCKDDLRWLLVANYRDDITHDEGSTSGHSPYRVRINQRYVTLGALSCGLAAQVRPHPSPHYSLVCHLAAELYHFCHRQIIPACSWTMIASPGYYFYCPSASPFFQQS